MNQLIDGKFLERMIENADWHLSLLKDLIVCKEAMLHISTNEKIVAFCREKIAQYQLDIVHGEGERAAYQRLLDMYNETFIKS